MAKKQEMKLKIFTGDVEAEAELNNSKTAKAIYESLPLEGAANRWGKEVYFVIPVRLDLEKDAEEVVEDGDIAYWPEGCCFCIFFGKTPASKLDEVRAASKVNVFGKIKDASIFDKVRNGDLVIVEKG
jgi:hypothetical protein|tara:strand:+ start:19662 stop:20045 length:384 start_codon:yes stop_codon:yes gene_type:complete